MRWQVAYTTAVAAGLFLSSSEAFTPRPHHVRTIHNNNFGPLQVGNWDNDNFLDSLNRREPVEPVVDDLSEEGTIGAELTEEMKQRMRASHTPDEERAQGGEMFRKLLERSQAAGARRPSSSAPPLYSELPPPAYPLPPPAAPAFSGLPANPDALSVEEQARLFREMMMQQQQAQQQPQFAPRQTLQPFPQAFPPQGEKLAPDGRKVGRNRDADAIVNTSDVYFAQLKRDSTTRTLARRSGDDEFANTVFADPSIQQIKQHVNPYFEEMKKKEKELLETAVDEMLLPGMMEPSTQNVDRSYAGISYEEKLAQRRKQKTKGAESPSQASQPQAPPPPQQQIQQSVPTAAVEAAPAPVVPKASVSVPPAPTQSVQPAPTQYVEPVPVQPSQAAPVAAAASATSSDMRQDLRTLQGLMLKHRGGPGFGPGRLKGAEVQRFQGLANGVIGTLKEEAAAASSISPPPQINPPTAQAALSTVSAPPAFVQPPPPAAASVSPARADSMIACMEGSFLMYKNSPPELRDTIVLPTLRAALISAVTTCNEVLGDANSQFPPTTSATSTKSLDSMITLMEGAIVMYKNCPTELKPSVLVTLRAALLSAITVCNAIMAQQEVQNVQAYQAATGTTEVTKTMPTQYYDVLPSAEQPKVQESPASPVVESKPAPAVNIVETLKLDDDNSQYLERIYSKLQNAAGEGKMGLRQDLSPEEASDLAQDIAEMRLMLVDELQNGIPNSP